MRNKFVIENGIVVSGTVTLVRKGNDFEKVPLADLADIKNPIIFGDIDLSGQGLTELPQMSNVIMYGSFLCQNNNLKSLKGMPRQVSGRVDCSNNKIKSLRHMSKHIGDGFNFSHNEVDSLHYLSEDIKGDIDASYNELVDLSYCVPECHGRFNCSYNKLVSLNGRLNVVWSTMDCSYNYLQNLEDMPNTIYGDLVCSGNEFPDNFNVCKDVPGEVMGNIIYDKKKSVKEKANINKFNAFIGKIKSNLMQRVN